MSPNAVSEKAVLPWWRLIDWRLVAAAGLPLWAFAFGMMVAGAPATAVDPATPPEIVMVPPPDDAIPPPREVVVRQAESITLPVVVPVPIPAAKPPEFQLPVTELLPTEDKCRTFGTTVRFHKTAAEAVAEARDTRKMPFVLHISGHFDDPGFT